MKEYIDRRNGTQKYPKLASPKEDPELGPEENIVPAVLHGCSKYRLKNDVIDFHNVTFQQYCRMNWKDQKKARKFGFTDFNGDQSRKDIL